MTDIYYRAANEYGVRPAIGTDFHMLNHMEYRELGVATARRGRLKKQDLVNWLSYTDLIKKFVITVD